MLFWSKCSIFHNILKCMIFQRHQEALLWSKGLKIVKCFQTEERYSTMEIYHYYVQ